MDDVVVEINVCVENVDGIFMFEEVCKLEKVRMIFVEGMRLYSASSILICCVIKDVMFLCGGNGKEIILKVGIDCFIVVWNFYWLFDLWEDLEKFDSSRFSWRFENFVIEGWGGLNFELMIGLYLNE